MNIDSDEYSKYMKVLENYYKLKHKYEKKKTDFKKKFLKKNPQASIIEKKQALEDYKKKRKCINCNKLGGTIFTKEGEHLVAYCNSTTPCKLNINIKPPTIIGITENLDNLKHDINQRKKIITEYKLDLLFELDDEEVILNEFQTNKDNLETMLSAVVELKEYYDKRNNLVEVPQINPDTGEVISGPFGEKIWASRKETLVKKQKELNQLISDFKRNIRLYKKENIIIGKQKILTDTLLIYKNIIVPLQNQIRELKYQKIYTDEIMDRGGARIMGEKVELMPIYNFYPMKVDIENQVMQNNDFEVQEFQK